MSELIKNSHVYFEDLTHTYWTADGKELKGVTTLMKEQGLSPDYSGISADVLQKAAEKGSAIHHAIDCYCKGLEYEASKAVEHFAALGLDVISSEYLVSDNESVASSIDIVLSDYSICDIKTTSTLHSDAVKWQLSIYAYLFELQNPTLKVPALYAIHIKNKTAKLIQIPRMESERVRELLEANIRGDKMYGQALVEADANSIPADFRKAYELLKTIEDMKQTIKQYESQIAEVKGAILNAMTERGMYSLENQYFKITRVSESVRTSVDADKLFVLYPEAYNECKKESKIAPSVRLTMRK